MKKRKIKKMELFHPSSKVFRYQKPLDLSQATTVTINELKKSIQQNRHVTVTISFN